MNPPKVFSRTSVSEIGDIIRKLNRDIGLTVYWSNRNCRLPAKSAIASACSIAVVVYADGLDG